MDKIKRLVLCNIPVTTCNLRCQYCYITLQKHWDAPLPKFRPSKEIAFALSKERLGGCCYIVFCGSGETLLPKQSVEIVRALLEEGHYVEIVTNGITNKRFDQIQTFPSNILERLTFKFSFHYLELIRLNKLDDFFGNISKMKKIGCSFSLEITPHDGLEENIDQIKKVCLEKVGALSHITIARNDTKKSIPVLSKCSLDEYCGNWESFDSSLLQFKKKIFGEKRNKFCYAGDWSIIVNIGNGDIRPCYSSPVVGNIFKKTDRPIKFSAIGKCPIAHCYNGHNLLTHGVIPSLETPTYLLMRNRKSKDGTEWINETMQKVMQQKLIDSNKEYNDLQKRVVKIKTSLSMAKFKGTIKIKESIRKLMR